MAAVYDLASALATAGAPPAPPPPGAAQANVLGLPARPVTPTPQPLAFGGGAALPAFNPTAQPQEPAAPARNPNISPFSNFLAQNLGGAQLPEFARTAREAQLQSLTAGPGALDFASKFFHGTDSDMAKLNAQASAAKVFADPQVQNYARNTPGAVEAMAQDPTGAAAAFHGALTAAQSAVQGSHTYAHENGTTFTKTAEDPAKLATHAQITGQDHKDVLPFAEPHNFTKDEFVQATKHLTWDQANRMFGAAHYLTPQQQLIPAYMTELAGNEKRAKADYDAAVANKSAPAEQKRLSDLHDAAKAERVGLVKKLIENANYIYPNTVP